MRTFFVLLSICLITTLRVEPEASLQGPSNGPIVEGVVVHAGSGKPIEAATVVLAPRENWDDRTRRREAHSDNDGRFLFRNVLPGEYVVFAGRDGYYWPGINKYVDPDTVTISGQSVTGMKVELVQLSVVTGRLLGTDGEPLIGATVFATQRYYTEDGTAVIGQGGGGGGDFTGAEYRSLATTDDRGDYRIFNLKPGEYYVGTYYLPRRAGIETTAYFPGIVDGRNASSVIVAPGAELAGISFRLPDQPQRPTFTISGNVAGTRGQPVEKFHLVRHDGLSSRELPNMAADRTQGTFQLRAVEAGTYDLYPEVRDESSRLYTARTRVEVRDKNVGGVLISVQPGVDLAGRVLIDGAPGIGAGEFNVSLHPKDGTPSVFLYETINGTQGPIVTLDKASGEFLFHRVPPGNYTIGTWIWPPDRAFLADVQQSGVSVLDTGFAVGENSSPIEVRISSMSGRLEGVTQDARQSPARFATVVLVPPPSRRQNGKLYKMVFADKDGQFKFLNVPPGAYKTFSWTDVPSNAWRNADFMSRHEQRGISVNITAGATTSVRLSVIPE